MKLLSLATALLLSSIARAQLRVIGCDVSEAIIPLPPSQTNLTVPSTQPNSIALGVGVQNYTCSSSGTYTYDRKMASHSKATNISFTALQEPLLSSSTSHVSYKLRHSHSALSKTSPFRYGTRRTLLSHSTRALLYLSLLCLS